MRTKAQIETMSTMRITLTISLKQIPKKQESKDSCFFYLWQIWKRWFEMKRIVDRKFKNVTVKVFSFSNKAITTIPFAYFANIAFQCLFYLLFCKWAF